MEQFKALFTSQYFTAGKVYSVVEYIANYGVTVYDDQNQPHGLSYDFLLRNFRKIERI